MTENGRQRRKRLADLDLEGAMAERVRPDGKRSLSLREAERRDLQRQETINQVVLLFLDIEQNHSWSEIAQSVGLSVRGLKDLTKSQDFMEAYNAQFAVLGSDPRLQAAQSAIADLLMPSIKALREMITNPRTAAVARLGAIKEVIRLNNIDGSNGDKDNRRDVVEFLKGFGAAPQVTIGTLNIQNPFQGDIEKFQRGEIIDGDYVEPQISPSLPPGDCE